MNNYYQRCICIEGDWDFREFPPCTKEFFLCVLNTLEKQILYVNCLLLSGRRMKMAHFRAWVRITRRTIKTMSKKTPPALTTTRSSRSHHYANIVEVLRRRVALLKMIAFRQ